ncbi:FAD-dependent oxidoreductase [Streptomyces sp. NBC_01433]|uniref:FAD/NAD(P)-dependent oxidoreductase n=1 Tax=Streptomyces sp. NBC_01433 TaxID=2903864 RepID=UPI00224CA0AB|nr:NAD(P)/FAD-dependent oxidoreductase [Streptomyces sp. NBC_01433]MCX4680439.1 FAD-dependent oxidoreductase [Streptomyces sp. NBC_01433]
MVPDPPLTSCPEAGLAVVGAGPAGMAAAVTAADHGILVTVLDAAARPGGQFYRSPAPGLGATRPEALHHGWDAFTALAARFDRHVRRGRISHLARHQVWAVERAVERAGERAGERWRLHAVTGTEEDIRTVVDARSLLIATGSHERQLPLPGWTTPGVVGAAGAQAMLKSGLVLPGRRIVVAGSGPLLQAVAISLARSGAEVPLLVEAAGYGFYARAPTTLVANPAKLAEGARNAAQLVRHGVRVLTHSAVTAVHGRHRVEGVTVSRLDRDWRPVPGTGRRHDCDAVALGHGLEPRTGLATSLGCATRERADGTHGVVVDAQLRTTVPGVWAAGETGGIGGVQLAMVEGELAALSVVRLTRAEAAHLSDGGLPRRAVALRRARTRMRAFAEVMGAAHRPRPGWRQWLSGDTEVCRCEEVTADRILTSVAELGAGDARTVKLLTRAGMGWCQGQTCGFAVRELVGPAASGAGPGRQALACPVLLSVLAGQPRATGAAGGSDAAEAAGGAAATGGSGTTG